MCIALIAGGAYVDGSNNDAQMHKVLKPMPVNGLSASISSSDKFLLWGISTPSPYTNIGEIGSDEIFIATAPIIPKEPIVETAPSSMVHIEPTPIPTAVTPSGTTEQAAWLQFLEGYRQGGGNPQYESMLVCVGSHEGRFWIGYYGQNGYWSRFQFSLDTWIKVTAYLESIGVVPNPDSPYVIGLGVAWWSNNVDPSGTGGWYNTWRLCLN